MDLRSPQVVPGHALTPRLEEDADGVPSEAYFPDAPVASARLTSCGGSLAAPPGDLRNGGATLAS